MVELTYLVGILLALAAAVAGAAQYLFIRIGTDEGNAYDAVLIVMLTNVLLLVPPVLVLYYPDYRLTLISWLSFIAAGVFGTLLGRLSSYLSIDRIGASRTAPVVASWALISTVLGVALLDESVTSMHAVGVVLIVGGVVTIAWETSQENPDDLSRRELLAGLALPFAAAVAYAWEPIFANVGFAENTPSVVGLSVKTVAATLGFVLYLRMKGALPHVSTFHPSNAKWFVLGGIGNTLFLLCYYVALENAPVSIVTPIIITNTLFVVLLSAAFMPRRLERVTWLLASAATVVVLGVLTITVFG